jgi:hypothetical protein
VTSAVASNIATPDAQHGGELKTTTSTLWVGIERGDGQGPPVYSVGRGDQGAAAEDRRLTEARALQRLEALAKEAGPAEVRIRADRALPYEVVKHMQVELQKRREKGFQKILADVSTGTNP